MELFPRSKKIRKAAEEADYRNHHQHEKNMKKKIMMMRKDEDDCEGHDDNMEENHKEKKKKTITMKLLKRQVHSIRTQTKIIARQNQTLRRQINARATAYLRRELKLTIVDQLLFHQRSKLDSAGLTCPTQLIPYRYTTPGFPLKCTKPLCKGIMSYLSFQEMSNCSENGIFCTTCHSTTQRDNSKEGFIPDHSLAFSAEMDYVFKVIEFNSNPLAQLHDLKLRGELQDVAGFIINWNENDISGRTQPTQIPIPFFKRHHHGNTLIPKEEKVQEEQEQENRVKALIPSMPLLRFHSEYRMEAALLCSLLNIAGQTFQTYLCNSESKFPAELLNKNHIFPLTGRGSTTYSQRPPLQIQQLLQQSQLRLYWQEMIHRQQQRNLRRQQRLQERPAGTPS